MKIAGIDSAYCVDKSVDKLCVECEFSGLQNPGHNLSTLAKSSANNKTDVENIIQLYVFVTISVLLTATWHITMIIKYLNYFYQ